ncbi:MAG: mannitol dehydrogenase family protein [Oscillospiraceae bacterium]|nr:mannitol dehydrogenase family protein [Oscillospiraceae bacterium]
MKLNENSLKDREFWQSKGYEIPLFDRETVRERTKSTPEWLHFGAGNIFRAYIAKLAQHILDMSDINTGIIAAEGYDYEIIDAVYKPFDELSISVTLSPDGNMKKTVLGSVVDSLKTNEKDMPRLREIFASKSLQFVTLTITEKGYSIVPGDASTPDKPVSFLGTLTALCLHRYKNGAYPLAIVSLDNCSHNGVLLYMAVRQLAAEWVGDTLADDGFLDYIDNPGLIAFPNTMIDKITPYPDKGVARKLSDDGVEDMFSHVTAKGSVTAPFVNAEEPEYLVIEDIFPNGRPPLEKAGVIFTDRETVDKFEKMKVCTCLNPLHTALSVFACMLSYKRVSDAMKDEDLLKLVHMVAKEGLKVVVDPGIISPKDFIDTVINVRLPNPYIPDTPQRIATDTSKKLAVRFGETIKAYARSEKLKTASLVGVPLVLAGWCRYLMAIDDNGDNFILDPDPMLPRLLPHFEEITLGADVDCKELLAPILSKTEIFGADLYETGLADKVAEYFKMMIKGKGAVRKTIHDIY